MEHPWPHHGRHRRRQDHEADRGRRALGRRVGGRAAVRRPERQERQDSGAQARISEEEAL